MKGGLVYIGRSLVYYIFDSSGRGGSEKIICYIPHALIYTGDQNYKIFKQHNVKHQTNKNRRDYDN